MHEPTVYSILQTQKGDKQVARLLDALDDLAGRLESVNGSEAAGSRQQTTLLLDPAGKHSTTKTIRGHHGLSNRWELCSLPLPDPQAGPLPLFPGASEFDALQSAASATSSKLQSNEERQAWRSWLMGPSHFMLVVEAGWLLLSLMFKQDDPGAPALQAHIFDQLAHHYVSEILRGPAVVDHAAGLWAQALAHAACQLLRAAFPTVPELQDAQLQHVLHRQLRLWTTGLLPSDAGALCLRPAVPAAIAVGSEGAGNSQEAGNSQDAAASHSAPAASRTSRCAAPFVSVKPGPLVSSFKEAQGVKPAALQAPGPKLRSLTVPQQQLEQQQQFLAALDKPFEVSAAADQTMPWSPQQALQQTSLLQPAAAALTWTRLQQEQHNSMGNTSSSSSSSASMATSAVLEAAELDIQQLPSTETAASGSPSRSAQAAACLAAAAAAAEQYRRSKKAGAAVADKRRSKLQQQMQQLQLNRGQMLRAGRDKVQAASNHIAGWLSEPSGSSACLPAAVTDAQCKAQRQLMQGHLRLGDWKMAHAFNTTVHDKCLDMAAAVAVVPPPPVVHGPSSSCDGDNSSSSGQRYDRPGGGWADVAGCSLVSNRVDHMRSGAGASSTCKITKAARAIVEDVQRKFAASPTAALHSPQRRQ